MPVASSLAPAEVGEILVRAPNWVGDVVMATPGLRALRAGFKGAQITVQVRPGLEALLAGSPFVDHVVSVSSYHAGFPALIREALAFDGGRFDLGVCIPESFSSALLQRASGVRCVVGYAGGMRSPLLHRTAPVPESWGGRRLVAREQFVLHLVEALGCPGLGTHLELSVLAEEEERVEAELSRRGVAPGDLLVAMAPGASFGPSKWWPADYYARVGDAMTKLGARVVLMGSPAERELSIRVADQMNEEPIDLTGVIGLGEAKALMRRTSLLICNDAGARHIAVAFGVPCIVFMGPTSLEKTNLNLEGLTVLETDESCRPCYKRNCPIDHPCMKKINPEDVISLARSTLGFAVR